MKLLEIKNLSKNYDKKPVLKDISLEISNGKIIGLLGKNGVGKTTLIKKIYEELRTRKDIKVGYMPQVYEEVFDDYETVLDFIAPKTKDDITKARMYLGNLNFTKEEMEGSLKNLSNGTKAKLFLIQLVLNQCNVLILDEPTRNISPLSNPVIRKVLKDFKGTIISISHDRKYIEEVVNQVYLFAENGLKKVSKFDISSKKC